MENYFFINFDVDCGGGTFTTALDVFTDNNFTNDEYSQFDTKLPEKLDFERMEHNNISLESLTESVDSEIESSKGKFDWLKGYKLIYTYEGGW